MHRLARPPQDDPGLIAHNDEVEVARGRQQRLQRPHLGDRIALAFTAPPAPPAPARSRPRPVPAATPPARSRYREILEKAEARVKAFGRREQLRQAEDRQAQRHAARTLSPSERWATIRALEAKHGLTDPDLVAPFTSQEVETYKDTIIARPPDYDVRIDAYWKQELREVLAKRAAIAERQRQKAELAASQAMVARII